MGTSQTGRQTPQVTTSKEARVNRPGVDVRRAGPGDVEDLLSLWGQAREESGGTARAILRGTAEQLRTRLGAALGGSDVHLLLARWDGRPAGYAALRVAPLMPIVDEPCVHVESLFVAPQLRRHGIAKLLLAAAAAVAERSGAEQVVISTPPSSRDAQRFPGPARVHPVPRPPDRDHRCPAPPAVGGVPARRAGGPAVPPALASGALGDHPGGGNRRSTGSRRAGPARRAGRRVAASDGSRRTAGPQPDRPLGGASRSRQVTRPVQTARPSGPVIDTW